MKIKFYLNRPKAESTGIFSRLSYSGHMLKYYLPEHFIPSNQWDSKTQRVKDKYKGSKSINNRIIDFKHKAQELFDKYVIVNNIQPSPNSLRDLLDKNFKTVEEVKVKPSDRRFTFFGYFQDMIDKSESGERLHPTTSKPISKNTIKTYKTTIKLLRQFQEQTRRHIDFNNIDTNFYEELKRYALNNRYSDKNDPKKKDNISVGYSTNSIGKHIQVMKTVLNEATDLGYNTNTQYKSKMFRTLREEVDTIYLTDDEISLLEKIDLSDNHRYEVERDLFLIGCYTAQGYSDYSDIKNGSVSNGYLKYKRKKTGQNITIPIKEGFERILSKYNGKLPVSKGNQKSNLYIKEIAKKIPELTVEKEHTETRGGVTIIKNVPKYELITTHTARRSFATNEYLRGTPILSIMALTGHKTEKSFMKYIRLSSDEHAKLVQLHWEKKGSQLQAV